MESFRKPSARIRERKYEDRRSAEERESPRGTVEWLSNRPPARLNFTSNRKRSEGNRDESNDVLSSALLVFA